MAAFTKEKLASELEAHCKWLNNNDGGKRLDLTGAVLTGADLTGAVLARAVLRRLDLTGADLTDADLRRADLTGADLTRADLTGAVLTVADLTGAVLTGADLTGADLTRADLTGADLTRADLTGADLTGADLTGADLRRAVLISPRIPVVSNIDAAIVAAIDAGGSLEMTKWHTCETTHCRAGWAITLAGPVGAFMESIWGASVAGALIYAASDPNRKIPDFYTDNKTAMTDMRERAAAQLAESAA